MSIACVTVERFLDHISIANGEFPDIRTALVAKAFVSPDDTIEFHDYTGVEFQWQTGSSINGPFIDIPGAVSATYKPVMADKGKYLRVEVTFDNNTYYAVTNYPVSDLVFTPVFYDGKGDSVPSLAGSPMGVKLKYHNKTAETLSLTMYVAVYDSKGILKYLESEAMTLESDALEEFGIPLAFTSQPGDYAKVFLWDSGYLPERESFRFD
jgi:hypothetical protein